MLVTKWACHATSMMKRTFILVSLWVPQNPSTTKSLFPESWSWASFFTDFHTLSDISWLSLGYSGVFHQTVFLEFLSMTMYLSLGERPVNTPVMTLIAPSSVTCPFSKPVRPGLVSSL